MTSELQRLHYRYSADLIRVIDGDTIFARIDLGFKIYKEDYVRLFGVNAPEIRTSKGLDAKMFTTTWFTNYPSVYIESNKYDEREKYGRILATIYREDDPVSLNNALVTADLAVEYDG